MSLINIFSVPELIIYPLNKRKSVNFKIKLNFVLLGFKDDNLLRNQRSPFIIKL